MNEKQKNKQLQYIKEHFAWLIVLSVAIISVTIITIYIGWRVYNAIKFHVDINKRVEILEMK